MQVKVDGNHGKRKQPQTPKAWNLKNNEVKKGKKDKNEIKIDEIAVSSLNAAKRRNASTFQSLGPDQ